MCVLLAEKKVNMKNHNVTQGLPKKDSTTHEVLCFAVFLAERCMSKFVLPKRTAQHMKSCDLLKLGS